METLDYGTREAPGRDPLLGRISAICLLLDVVAFGVLGVFFQHTSETIDDVISCLVITIWIIGEIVSIIAMVQRKSRTKLAWVAFSIQTFLWIFYFLAFFGGM